MKRLMLRPDSFWIFLHQTLRPAEGERRVQFRLGVDVSGTPLLGVRVVERAVLAGVGIPRFALDRCNGQVTRKRHCDNAFTVCRDVDQHDGVGSGAARVLGAAGAHLAVGPGARVHADHQEVFVAELCVRVDDVARPEVQCADRVHTVVLRRTPLVCPAGHGQGRRRDRGDHQTAGHQHRAVPAATPWRGLVVIRLDVGVFDEARGLPPGRCLRQHGGMHDLGVGVGARPLPINGIEVGQVVVALRRAQ